VALLEVLHFPDNRLRKKADPVENIDNNCRSLAGDMLETMYANRGIGLAATQVNVQKRLVVIDLSEDKNEAICLINPEILSSVGAEESQEGCLSVPEYFENDADGLLAVCIQHEIDHLDGKLFIDYLSPMKRQRLRKKLDKQEKFQAPVL
jgi:peptide deformylase